MTREELIQLTRETWEPAYGRKLSDEECEEIIQNVTDYCTLLLDHAEDIRGEEEQEEESA